MDIVEPFWATLAELTRVGFKHSAVTGQGIEHTIEANVVVVVDLEEAPDRLQIAKAVEVREVGVVLDDEVARDVGNVIVGLERRRRCRDSQVVVEDEGRDG